MAETGGQIYQLIPKVMKAIGPIAKGRQNQQQGYRFRGIDEVYNAAQPVLADLGVFIVPEVVDRWREERPTRDGKGVLIYTTLKVKHTFFAGDGSSVSAVTVGEAMDSGDKSSNKAMSAAMKYAMFEVFCIPTEGDHDTEDHSPEVGPGQMGEAEKRGIALGEAFDARNIPAKTRSMAVAGVCTKHKVKRITDLPADKWAELLKAIAGGAFDPKPAAEKAAA